MIETSPVTALALHQPRANMPAWVAGISAELPEALAVGKVFIDSGFGPKDCKGPAAIVVAVAMGARLGLDPFSSIHGIAVINGRPSIYGDAMLAVCQNHPAWDDFAEEWTGKQYDDDFTASCSVMRKGRAPKTETFSVFDAKKAGLWGKVGPWSGNPKRMLMMRARAFALRGAFGDALAGFHAREELDDEVGLVDVTASAVVRAHIPEAVDATVRALPAVKTVEAVAEIIPEPTAPTPDLSITACHAALTKLWKADKPRAQGVLNFFGLKQVSELKDADDETRARFLDHVAHGPAKAGAL